MVMHSYPKKDQNQVRAKPPVHTQLPKVSCSIESFTALWKALRAAGSDKLTWKFPVGDQKDQIKVSLKIRDSRMSLALSFGKWARSFIPSCDFSDPHFQAILYRQLGQHWLDVGSTRLSIPPKDTSTREQDRVEIAQLRDVDLGLRYNSSQTVTTKANFKTELRLALEIASETLAFYSRNANADWPTMQINLTNPTRKLGELKVPSAHDFLTKAEGSQDVANPAPSIPVVKPYRTTHDCKLLNTAVTKDHLSGPIAALEFISQLKSRLDSPQKKLNRRDNLLFIEVDNSSLVAPLASVIANELNARLAMVDDLSYDPETEFFEGVVRQIEKNEDPNQRFVLCISHFGKETRNYSPFFETEEEEWKRPRFPISARFEELDQALAQRWHRYFVVFATDDWNLLDKSVLDRDVLRIPTEKSHLDLTEKILGYFNWLRQTNLDLKLEWSGIEDCGELLWNRGVREESQVRDYIYAAFVAAVAPDDKGSVEVPVKITTSKVLEQVRE